MLRSSAGPKLRSAAGLPPPLWTSMIDYFGRDSPNSGWSLRVGQKRKRSADASSVSYRVIDSFPSGELAAARLCRGAQLLNWLKVNNPHSPAMIRAREGEW
jgi:hypothetical protein